MFLVSMVIWVSVDIITYFNNDNSKYVWTIEGPVLNNDGHGQIYRPNASLLFDTSKTYKY